MKSKEQSQQQDYELIQRFLDFELSDAEIAEVERRLEEDTLFQQRLSHYQTMELAVEQIGTKAEAKIVEMPTVRSIWRRAPAIAAGLVLAIGLLFALNWFSSDPASGKVLAQQYWEEQNDWSDQLRSATYRSELALTNVEDSILQRATTILAKGDTTAALQTLAATTFSTETAPKVLLLKGEIYYQQNDFQSAITQYDQLLQLSSNAHRDRALMAKSLAHIQLEQFEEAKSTLQILIEEDYALAGKAKKLLRKL